MNNGISPKNFYSGSTKKEFLYLLSKKRRRIERENEYKKRPLPKIQIYENCFTERRVWKQFHRQQEALEYCQTVKEKFVCLFSLEKQDGKRSFLVTTRKQFWNKYNVMDPRKRHFYEVIVENTPCRLYFDIEFKYEFNPGLDGSVVTELFIKYVCHCIYKEFNIQCTKRNVIDMTSSTDAKFSRHLIFNHPNLLFQNNIQCGDFVKNICFLLRSFFLTGSHNKFLPIHNNDKESLDLSTKDLQGIMIINEKKEQVFLCDLCVYTKNRNFRLYLSSKVSKQIPLVLLNEGDRYIFKTKPKRQEMYIKYQMKNLRFDEDFEKFAETMVCPAEFKECDVLCYGNGNSGKIERNYIQTTSQPNNQYKTGVNSLFPDLDKLVLDMVNRNGPKGHIRRWIHYEDRQMIIYDIGDNRWCGNIQREHKSNHVYYVADLKFSQIYQKCHDFECSLYRSEDVVIPQEINPICTYFKDTSDADLMAIFDSDIDFVGKKEEFFEEDAVFNEEILKLSTTDMFRSCNDSSASSIYRDDIFGATRNDGLSDSVLSNHSYKPTNDDIFDSTTTCNNLLTHTTIANNTADSEIIMCSSDDDFFLDKSLSFTDVPTNNELLNSSADLFTNSKLTWSNCDTISTHSPQEDSILNLAQTPQENLTPNVTPSLNSVFQSTNTIIKSSGNLGHLNSNTVALSSSQENTLNEFFEEDFSFD